MGFNSAFKGLVAIVLWEQVNLESQAREENLSFC
jgi:hypothetical protein